MDLGILVSGNLGLTVLKALMPGHKAGFVLTDKKSKSVIEFCQAHKIPFFAGNPRGQHVIKKLGYPACDLIVSVNYLFIVERDIISYPKKMAINFHGSLLPKYRGRTPHVWAIINNEKTTGITAHLIDDGCDTGDIVSQVEIPIEENYTGQDVLDIFEKRMPGFVLETIAAVESNTISFTRQDNDKATFFGKRTPESGLISWEWQKERIYNWVRAQARPYPGAFSFIKGNKIVIHKIEYSTMGYDYTIDNGKIVAFENGCPVIKTPNGCVRIVDFEYGATLNINDVLN